MEGGYFFPCSNEELKNQLTMASTGHLWQRTTFSILQWKAFMLIVQWSRVTSLVATPVIKLVISVCLFVGFLLWFAKSKMTGVDHNSIIIAKRYLKDEEAVRFVNQVFNHPKGPWKSPYYTGNKTDTSKFKHILLDCNGKSHFHRSWSQDLLKMLLLEISPSHPQWFNLK